MKKTFELLEILTVKFPPEPPASHLVKISTNTPGNLSVAICFKGAWQEFYLSEEDFDKPASELAEEIAALMPREELVK